MFAKVLSSNTTNEQDLSQVRIEEQDCSDYDRSEGLARTRLFHPWGCEPEGGVVRLQRSVSHVVRHGHMLTSGWVLLGPVRAHRGSSGTRMGPYLSRTPIRVHRVFRQGSSGAVGPYRPISAKSAKVRSGPKTSNLARNGSRIDRLARNKDQMNPTTCPDPSGPLLRPKTAKKTNLRKTAPGGPRGPRRPPALLSAQAGAYVPVIRDTRSPHKTPLK